MVVVADFTVLHADDDEALRDVTGRYLERELEGVDIVTAADGTEALSTLESRPDVDVVVSDYQMPKMDGLELFEAVREQRPELPFILFTGKGSEEIASEAISVGVTDYLQKETGTDQYTVLANRIEHAVATRRSRAELERTERRYRTLISEAVDVIAIVNRDGLVDFVSPAARRVLEYEPQDLQDRSIFDFVHPADRSEATAALAALVEDPDATPAVEVRFERGDEEWIRLEARGRNLLDDEAIEGIVIHARNVTDRWEREQELEQYERIVEVAGDGAYVLDEEGRYEMVNDRTVERTGYSREELLGTHGSLVFDVADVEKARNAALRVFRNEDVSFAQFEATVHGKDGTQYPVEIRTAPIVEDGRIVGSVGISRDIPHRKARELELERYERLVETMADAAQITDAEGRFVVVNRALLELTGYDRAELLGETPRAIVDDADYDRSTAAVGDLLEDPDRRFAELEMTIQPKAGEPFPVETRIAPLTEDGEFVGTVGVTRDIADRVATEQSLRRQNEQLEQFLRVVAHDLRNPLEVAQARLGMVEAEFDSPHLEPIADAHDRMAELVEDLLSLATGGRPIEEPECQSLERVARSAWSSVATADATLEIEGDRELTGDPSRLRQLFENLFRNAVEHGATSPPGSQTGDDAVESADGGVRVRVGPTAEGGFFVADDGPGVPEDIREEVFEPTYTTQDDGTGLGLTIVDTIAAAHDWEVTLGDAGPGARFEFRPTADATR